jgi:hypothetical protein
MMENSKQRQSQPSERSARRSSQRNASKEASALPDLKRALASPAGVLSLQRAIGNRAVNRLSRRGVDAAPSHIATPAGLPASDPADVTRSAQMTLPAYGPDLTGAHQPNPGVAHGLISLRQASGSVQRYTERQLDAFYRERRRSRRGELASVSNSIQDRQARGEWPVAGEEEPQSVDQGPEVVENGDDLRGLEQEPELVEGGVEEREEADPQTKQPGPKISGEILEAFGQFSSIVSSGGSVLNYFGAQGSDNLGFYDTGTKGKGISGDFSEHKDAGRSAGGDVVNTVGSVGADALGIATMDKDTAKTFWGKLQKVGMAIRMLGTVIRGGAGASQAKLGLDGSVLKDASVPGELSKFGTAGAEGANTATLMKGVGDSVANVGTSAVFLGKLGFQARRGMKFVQKITGRGKHGKGSEQAKNFRDRTAMGHAERGGRFLTTLADLFQGGAAATQGMARSAAWIANMVKGGGGAAASASNVAATAMTVSGIGSAVVGGLQAIAGAIKVGRAGKRRSKITERLIDEKRPMTGDVKAAFEHVHEIQKKRQKRGAVDIAAGAMGVVGGVMAATGFGVIPGVVLGATAAGIMLGRFLGRKIQKYGRDKKAARIAVIEETWAGLDRETLVRKRANKEMLDAYDADMAFMEKVNAVRDLRSRKAQGESLTLRERLTLATSFEEDKNTAAKELKSQKTLNTIKGMGEEDQDIAVKALGIDIKKWRQNKGTEKADEMLTKALAER